jgi:hypothetical protein
VWLLLLLLLLLLLILQQRCRVNAASSSSSSSRQLHLLSCQHVYVIQGTARSCRLMRIAHCCW